MDQLDDPRAPPGRDVVVQRHDLPGLHRGDAGPALACRDRRSRLLAEADDSREATWRERALNAFSDGKLPVLVAYNVPGRDCSQYSAGGARNRHEQVARGSIGRKH